MALTLKDFLRSEVVPSLGCTEPGAVALSAARACEELETHFPNMRRKADINAITVEVSDGIYKNGKSVGIPGAGGKRGNAMAAALGACCGRSAYGLEVLRDCTIEDAEIAEGFIREGRVRITRMPGIGGVYVKAVVSTGKHEAACVIQREHSNIVAVIYNGRNAVQSACLTEEIAPLERSVSQRVSELSYAQLMRLADEMDDDDEHYLLHGAAMCKAIAEHWLNRPDDRASPEGVDMGRGMRDLALQADAGGAGNHPGYRIRQLSCAAADARMAGAPLPVMSSAGSGNHGITAILPVAVLGQSTGKSDHEIARALAISHLSTSYVKSRLGRLTPVCGCAVAAGSGAAAGMASLLGGYIDQCAAAMHTVLAATLGMICDGAKETCALKVGVGATEAYFAAHIAMQGRGVNAPGGAMGASLQETVENISLVSREGMKNMDEVIIGILESRQ